jgi:hypothetical protein
MRHYKCTKCGSAVIDEFRPVAGACRKGEGHEWVLDHGERKPDSPVDRASDFDAIPFPAGATLFGGGGDVQDRPVPATETQKIAGVYPASPETEIITAIASVPGTNPPGGGDSAWTAELERTLVTLGEARGYKVCAAGFLEESEKKWPFDLVWYREDANEYLREIGLILALVWSRDPIHIQRGFEKLLIAKSPIKVMVFQDYEANLPALWPLFDTAMRAFHKQSVAARENYILAAYENSKAAFAFRTVTA